MADALTRRYITTNPYDDPRDRYDQGKWSFSDDSLITYVMDDYPYKINDTGSSIKNVKQVSRLVFIRKGIDLLCVRVLEYIKKNLRDPMVGGLLIFLDIHATFKREPSDSIYYTDNFNQKLKNNRYISSKYLLSELPWSNKVAMQFNGLDVPKLRFIDLGASEVGPDKNIRAAYRDIYLSSSISGRELRDLVIHELSHTICNHCLYRPSDHHNDFKQAEALLKSLSKGITFTEAI